MIRGVDACIGDTAIIGDEVIDTLFAELVVHSIGEGFCKADNIASVGNVVGYASVRNRIAEKRDAGFRR